MIGFRSYRHRQVDLDDPVEVYRNLNLPGGVWWSLRQRGVVVGHCRSVTLCDARVHVNTAAQARIAAGANREVHAHVRGLLTDEPDWATRLILARVIYRPHLSAHFHYEFTPDAHFGFGDIVHFNEKGMFA